MRIESVPIRRGVGRMRGRVLEYLETHPDEAFRLRQCGEVADALGALIRTVEYALWSLQRDGLISKARLGNEIWYGSHAAIEELISLRPDAVRL